MGAKPTFKKETLLANPIVSPSSVATKPSNAFFAQNLARAALVSNLSATQTRYAAHEPNEPPL